MKETEEEAVLREAQEDQALMLAMAHRCQLLLDEILEPVPPQIQAEMAELREAEVSEAQIASLYPVELADYVPGINALAEVQGLETFARLSDDLEQFSAAKLRLREEVLMRYYTYATDLHPKIMRLLGAVALLRLLRSAPLPQVLVAPAEDSVAITQRLLRLENFLLDLHHLQRLNAEPRGSRRALIRLGYQLTRLRNGRQLGDPKAEGSD